MKQQKSTFTVARALPGILMLFVVAMMFSACKKNSAEETSVKDDIAQSAKLVNGKLFQGQVTCISNESAILFTYNNGSRYVIIEKLVGYKYPQISNISSAELVLSDHGVILKDANANTVYLLTNNDPESTRAFSAAAPLFKGNIFRTLIYGTTIIRG